MSAANKQCYALQCLGNSLRKANMDMRARTIMDETLTKLCDDVGACERIFKTPIPVIYTRHTSRYVGLWLALLPLAIWSVDPSWNHLITIPSTMTITFFLLGIEELGLQAGPNLAPTQTQTPNPNPNPTPNPNPNPTPNPNPNPSPIP